MQHRFQCLLTRHILEVTARSAWFRAALGPVVCDTIRMMCPMASSGNAMCAVAGVQAGVPPEPIDTISHPGSPIDTRSHPGSRRGRVTRVALAAAVSTVIQLAFVAARHGGRAVLATDRRIFGYTLVVVFFLRRSYKGDHAHPTEPPRRRAFRPLPPITQPEKNNGMQRWWCGV